MTVSNATARKEFAGDGSTTSFGTSPMVFFDSSDLIVYVTDSSGNITTLTESTHYTVTGGAGSTGTVATTGLYGAPATGSTLVIARSIPYLQANFDPENNDGSDADALETAIDRLTMQTQQLDAALARTAGVAEGDVSGAALVLVPEAGTLLGWDSSTGDLVNFALDGTGLTPTSNLLRLNVEDQGPVTGGVSYTEKDLGTISSGTVTPDFSDRAHQKYTNGGAHTLAPDNAAGSCLLDITNNASAGAITTSGWTKVVGAFDTTNAHKFRCHCSYGSAGSLLTIQAMQ